MGEMVLFCASAVYFWQMMFHHIPRIASVFAGVLFFSMAGIVFQTHYQDFYRDLAAMTIAAILIRRTILAMAKEF